MENLKFNELVIAIAAQNYEPSLLHPNALKYSGVVPEDWELARQPVIHQQGSQVTFFNGIQIIAQPNRCLFMEPWAEKTEQELEAPSIARRYVSTLPNLDYRAVGINFRAYVPFEGNEAGPQDYISQQLLAAGDWQRCNAKSSQQELNLVYEFEQYRLNLTINSATFNDAEKGQIPILLFSGNFEYSINPDSSVEAVAQIQTIVEDWTKNLNDFQDTLSRFPAIKVAVMA